VGSVDQTWSGCLFSSGVFRPPAGGGTIGVRDKASGEIFALAGLATEPDVDEAVVAARSAQLGWAEQTYARAQPCCGLRLRPWPRGPSRSAS
jgi:acyl-CoA reductase-like NAD-dependent aldehyde dehydrogenase